MLSAHKRYMSVNLQRQEHAQSGRLLPKRTRNSGPAALMRTLQNQLLPGGCSGPPPLPLLSLGFSADDAIAPALLWRTYVPQLLSVSIHLEKIQAKKTPTVVM